MIRRKINIEKLLKETINHSFSYNEITDEVEDNLAELLENSKDNTFFYIGVNQFVLSYYKNNSTTEWDICAIFQIGFPYSFPAAGVIHPEEGTIDRYPDDHIGFKIRNALRDEIWSLFVFTKKKYDKAIFGFNNANSSKLSFTRSHTSECTVFAVLNEEQLGKPVYNHTYFYIDYFKAIQKIIEKGKLIERKKEFETFRDIDFEFVEVPNDAFLIDYIPFLWRYKKTVTDLFGFPTDTETLNLISNEVDLLENNKDIKKGDILFSYLSVYASERKYKVEVTIAEKDCSKAKHELILRSKRISPYYIVNYLKSDFIKELVLSKYRPEEENPFELELDGEERLNYFKNYYVYNSIRNFDDEWNNLDISNIPIFITQESNSTYFQKKYEWENYEKTNIQKRIDKNKHLVFYDNHAREIIIGDMKELKACFTNGTNKAAIILAGSILEAFLIDWLSEINDTNYFEEDYMVFDKYRRKERRAGLKDYIEAIEELKKPDWYEAASKATEIRKKRNLVHAKLYIDDKDISKETCTEVIDYLEYVINTRWNNSK